MKNYPGRIKKGQRWNIVLPLHVLVSVVRETSLQLRQVPMHHLNSKKKRPGRGDTHLNTNTHYLRKMTSLDAEHLSVTVTDAAKDYLDKTQRPDALITVPES